MFVVVAACLAAADADAPGAAPSATPQLTTTETTTTTVRERRPADVDDARLDDAGSPDALLRVPGVSLVHAGGPLAPVRPVLRGLSGSRLDVNVLDLPFVDVATGDIDAGLWPWMLGTLDVDVGAGSSLGGSVNFKRPAPGVAADIEVGSLSTLTIAARDVVRLGEHDGEHGSGVAGVAASGGFTAGDFVFRSVDAAGVAGDVVTRQNNDQRRLSLASFAEIAAAPTLRLRGAVVAAGHEGGIPGFATAPFLSLRGRRGQVSLGAGLSLKGPVSFDVDGFGSVSSRATTETTFDEGSALAANRVGARVRAKTDLTDDIDIGVTADGATSTILGVLQRQEAGATVSATAKGPAGNLGGHDLVGLADVVFAGRVVSDLGVFLPTGSLRIGGQVDGGTVFVGVARASRAPTLDERAAPQGFVQANPDLVSESASEVELGVVVDAPVRGFDGPANVTLRGVAHASRLDDAIVVVNRSAFVVVPVNTGAAVRAGVDLGGSVRVLPSLSFDLTASLLHSAVDATHAVLPGAPPFLLRSAAHVGDRHAGIDVVVTGRGASSSTLFGTLQAPGFVLVDLAARWPLSDAVGLKASINNALDVLDARDSNLLPLPGRLLFFSLEVHT